jgi:hypothetical protein
METPVVEAWAEKEYRPGVSAGAAARQLCRELGCSGNYPVLKRMLEDMLSDANVRAFDRSQILDEFRQAAPEAAAEAQRQSFYRLNPDAPVSKRASLFRRLLRGF